MISELWLADKESIMIWSEDFTVRLRTSWTNSLGKSDTLQELFLQWVEEMREEGWLIVVNLPADSDVVDSDDDDPGFSDAMREAHSEDPADWE